MMLCSRRIMQHIVPSQWRACNIQSLWSMTDFSLFTLSTCLFCADNTHVGRNWRGWSLLCVVALAESRRQLSSPFFSLQDKHSYFIYFFTWSNLYFYLKSLNVTAVHIWQCWSCPFWPRLKYVLQHILPWLFPREMRFTCIHVPLWMNCN